MKIELAQAYALNRFRFDVLDACDVEKVKVGIRAHHNIFSHQGLLVQLTIRIGGQTITSIYYKRRRGGAQFADEETSMRHNKKSRWHFVLAGIVVFALHASTGAQTQIETIAPPSSTAQTESGQMKTASRPDEPPNQLELLRKQIEQLKFLVERQQLSLAELQKQVAELKSRAQIAPAANSTDDGGIKKTEKDAHATDSSATPNTTSGESQAGNQKAAVVAGWDGDHAFLRSTDGNFETFFTGYAQLDFHGYSAGSNHPPNTFVVRRARLALEGKVARYFEYKIEGDFADTSSTLLRDFYVRLHRVDNFQLTFGHFREPYSQEEIRGDAVQDFVERSLVNNLAPSRQPGLMVSGVLHKGIFEYQLGAFNGKGLLAANNNGTPDVAGRVRFSPWKNAASFWLKGLAFGGASAYGRNKNGTSVRGQTESRSISFFAPETVNGRLWRANGELTWMLGPAAIRVEYDQTNQERRGLGPQGATLPGVVAKGYVGQFTYLLTGETKTESGAVIPKHNLFGDEKSGMGYGAWELKFRYSNLAINDGTAKSNRAQTFYFGPNWYLNKFVRYVLDFGLERFADPVRTPRPGDRNFFVILSRVQVAF
jgi:phosphate-selective porin OprO and OprP